MRRLFPFEPRGWRAGPATPQQGIPAADLGRDQT